MKGGLLIGVWCSSRAWTFGPIVLAVSAASCGGPTSPSTSSSVSTAQRLTVTGAAVLVVTQTVQLAAKTSSGQDVTTQAAWQSSNADVVSVSAGLLAAKSLGSATITATYQGVAGTENVAVQAGGPPASPTITACGSIVLPGTYVVANDLIATGSGPCLAVSSGGVQLDCRNHVIPSLGVSGVANVSIANCVVTTNLTPNNNLTNVSIDHSTLAGWTSNGAQQLTISNSHITGDGIEIFGGTSSIVTNNTLDHLKHTVSGAIEFEGGSGNQARQNAIDGDYDGSGTNHLGQDDGIILGDETNDTVDGNTVRNVFDAGVEGVDFVHNTTISNNVIVNTGTQGVGSYWCTNWEDNTISGNNVSQSPALSILEYDVGKACINQGQIGSFRNNRIVGNIFRNPVPGIFAGNPLVTRLHIVFDNLGLSGVSNNLIAGNDFGSEAGPLLSPIAGFVNGGGNICDPTTTPFCSGGESISIGLSVGGPGSWRYVEVGPMSLRLRWPLVNISAALLVAACGGGPTAPDTNSSPSVTRTLTIQGTTTLVQGASSQLTVSISDGSTPTGVSWQSDSAAVATISTTGLLTAIGPGQTFVTANASGLTARAAVTITAPNQGTLTACGSITAAGHYVLATDLATTSPCLRITDTTNVDIDCPGHSLGAISVSNVSGLTIRNCTLSGNGTIQMTAVNAGTIESCRLNSFISSIAGTNVEIRSNTIVITTSDLPSGIRVQDGGSNRVIDNSVDGGYPGGTARVGTDDGIIVQNEMNDVIQNNILSNVWDIGIEGVATVSSSTFSGNTITNVGAAGIGSGWCTSWSDNSISSNRVSLAPEFANFSYGRGATCGSTSPPPMFVNNQINSNVLAQVGVGTGNTFIAAGIDTGGSVSGNSLQGNDFSLLPAPRLVPLSGFVDKGGNLCGPPIPGYSNFFCDGDGTAQRIRRSGKG